MKIVCFGEIMLRLAPEGYYRFVQADKFGATFGGGEANVSVSLANYGMDACFVSKVPDKMRFSWLSLKVRGQDEFLSKVRIDE